MKKADKIVQDLMRDFMIFTIIFGIFMIAFGIVVFITFDGHTMFRRIFLSGCFIVPAIIDSWMVIRGYKGK